MSIKHCNWPSRMCFSSKSNHSIWDLNNITPENTAMPYIWAATPLRFSYHLFSNSAISLVPPLCPTPTVPIFSSICFTLLSRSIRTRVMVESTYSDHFYRLGALIIPVLMLSTYFLRDSTGLPWSCSIFFTVAMVVWISALMVAVSDRALDFILFVPSLS